MARWSKRQPPKWEKVPRKRLSPEVAAIVGSKWTSPGYRRKHDDLDKATAELVAACRAAQPAKADRRVFARAAQALGYWSSSGTDRDLELATLALREVLLVLDELDGGLDGRDTMLRNLWDGGNHKVESLAGLMTAAGHPMQRWTVSDDLDRLGLRTKRKVRKPAQRRRGQVGT